MKKLIIVSGLCIATIASNGQERKQTINKEYEIAGPGKVLRISNVNGFIKVEGYSGQKVVMEINENLKAKTQSSLDEMISKLTLGEEEYGDTLEVFVEGLCNCDCERGRRYNWNNCDVKGSFIYDFTVKVPQNLNLILSTVNKGDIEVKNVSGKMRANNVNGAIYLNDVREALQVRTINGDVEIHYTNLPKDNSEYYTLNGDLTVTYPPALSADMSFKSFNGDFYTNFAIKERLPAIATTSERGSRGTTYKINETTSVRVGNGGVKLDFETFNGDIFIKKNN
jgi:DUF4097 and DUF4098 domain-containing protein YvlB